MNSARQSTPLVAGFADGYVVHNRKRPKIHRFKYNMCWCVFDVDQINHWVSQSRWWSYNGRALFNIRDIDYVNKNTDSISEKIRQFIQEQSQQAFNGQVLLFTHPRFLGYGFNSVNFYCCYQGQQLVYLVSEITNTPWGEKHLYFHDCATAGPGLNGGYQFKFSKQFHISPFMPMAVDYDWQFQISEAQFSVKMHLYQQGVNVMNVILDTKITPFMENSTGKVHMLKAFQPWKMALGIYWQAFKLSLKKIPFYTHPNKQIK